MFHAGRRRADSDGINVALSSFPTHAPPPPFLSLPFLSFSNICFVFPLPFIASRRRLDGRVYSVRDEPGRWRCRFQFVSVYFPPPNPPPANHFQHSYSLVKSAHGEERRSRFSGTMCLLVWRWLRDIGIPVKLRRAARGTRLYWLAGPYFRLVSPSPSASFPFVSWKGSLFVCFFHEGHEGGGIM
ncbi:hypothetical protein LX32DRAFT_363526 [Colletotrichum zoysiae]|uniref:Uncharacterized protein n=1 Tax=Colletotrichum zoysiae TaxID=1216348 RepID=A0AAD9HHR2_9PEZI|nr:hypothetical protein LX32DRAFT_363526 [Colletotrichum zoysiae]